MKTGSGRMDISGLDITLGRIRQIETRISSIEQKINKDGGKNEPGVVSFEKVLNEKVQETKKSSLPEKFDKTHITKLIEKYSNENGLDKNLVEAVIHAESSFNNEAVSHAGAQGLMQLMPLTAEKLGVDDPFDPEQNIAGGTKYLRNLINKYNSVELGLAAYNAGPENVNKYGGIPPFSETQNYVKKVIDLHQNKEIGR